MIPARNARSQPNADDRYLFYIACFKLIKGVCLLVVAVGILRLIHKDLHETAVKMVDFLHFDPGNQHIATLLQKLGLISQKQIKEMSGATFFYSALFLTEGIGLFLKKRWAEYLTAIATASFIPLEVYEIARHPGFGKIILLFANLAIIWYLVVVIRKKKDA